MSTQIALYKLDIIRKTLVANRFNKKKADNLKTIGKLVYDAAVVKIPKPIMTLFTKEESDFINYDPKSGKPCSEAKYFKTLSYISWQSSRYVLNHVLTLIRNEGIELQSSAILFVNFELPYPLPCTEDFITKNIIEEINKKTELYEAIKEHILRDKEIITLDNKIKCLFSSKRFYTSTLKNEFPEAYEVYLKKFEGKNLEEESTPESTTCDSIESIRATLLSNK